MLFLIPSLERAGPTSARVGDSGLEGSLISICGLSWLAINRVYR